MGLQGTAVAATTRREGAALAVGATGGYSAHAPSVTCRQVGPVLLCPVSKFEADMFGTTTQAIRAVFCDQVTPIAGEMFPVQEGDTLILPSGEYPVIDYRDWGAGGVIYVGIPRTHP